MTVESIPQQMMELRLTGMRESFDSRLTQGHKNDLGNEDFLSLLLQDEIEYRRIAKIKRLIKRASFRQPASLEEIDLSTKRGLDKKQINDFATRRYLLDGGNILILGPTGIGKTYLATALGNAACRAGHTVLFFRMNSLIEQLALARAKSTYLNFLKRLANCDLLILDDLGIKPLEPSQFQDLFDVLDERGEERSLIATTQVPPENWHEVIADPISCEAISDRITSSAATIVMKGYSYRTRRRKRMQLDKV